MIPAQLLDGTLTSNTTPGEFDIVPLSIDTHATAHIMSVLTDLYSDRPAAVVREYSTNALDAHRLAGIDLPIKVSTPSVWSPYLIIEDFGVGLDDKDIFEIYSKYGASSKRNSNDFNGMLGLGCKSALTYTSQFTISSVKDGIRYEVSVSRNPDGVGEMEIVGRSPSDEPSGVKITIPVKQTDFRAFIHAAKELFRHWPRGSVLLNEETPSPLTESAEMVSENIYIDRERPIDRIVMGNVAYPLPANSTFFKNVRNFGIVYFADMGEVVFTPSREGLQNTKKTMAVIERISEKFLANLVEYLQKSIDELDSRQEAWSRHHTLKTKYSSILSVINGLTYRGEEFPREIIAPYTLVNQGKLDIYHKPIVEKSYELWRTLHVLHDSVTVSKPRSYIYISDVSNSYVFITGFTSKIITNSQKKKIRLAKEQGLFSGDRVLLTETHPSKKWFDKTPVVEWSTINAIKLTVNRKQIAAEHFLVVTKGQTLTRTINKNEFLAVVSPTVDISKQTHEIINGSKYSLVILASNRHDKFKRDYPNTLTLSQLLHEIKENYAKSLTENEKLVLSVPNSQISLIQKFISYDLDVHDPAMVGLMKAVKSVEPKELRRVASLHGYPQPLKNYFKEYHLFDTIPEWQFTTSRTKHFVEYMNAIYRKENP